MTHTDNFKYDFQGARILKRRSDGIEHATINGLFDRVSELDSLGKNVYYVPAGGRIVAVIVWDESFQTYSVYYLHDDQIGSIAAITSPVAKWADAHAYDPFGTTREASDPALKATPFSVEALGFTQRELDPEIGLLNMVGRLYDPYIGRFTTPDPFESVPFSSQSYNRYSYALNNPFSWTDPSGLQVEPGYSSFTIAPPIPLAELPAVTGPEEWGPEEWGPVAPLLTEPPALTSPDEWAAWPSPLPAGVSDDSGLNPPSTSIPPYSGPTISAVTPEEARSQDIHALFTLSLPVEKVGNLIPRPLRMVGSNVEQAQFAYGVAKYFLKDAWVNICKFVRNQPEAIAVGASGQPIFETDEKLAYEAQKSIFDLAMLALPFRSVIVKGPRPNAEPLAS